MAYTRTLDKARMVEIAPHQTVSEHVGRALGLITGGKVEEAPKEETQKEETKDSKRDKNGRFRKKEATGDRGNQNSEVNDRRAAVGVDDAQAGRPPTGGGAEPAAVVRPSSDQGNLHHPGEPKPRKQRKARKLAKGPGGEADGSVGGGTEC